MEANLGNALILGAIGVFIGVAISFGLSCITAPSGESENVTNEIQEKEMEVIGSYKMGAFQSVWKIHDNRDNVTCWIHGEKGGMSCIPDHMITP